MLLWKLGDVMKFKKSFLAVAVALTAFGANAATYNLPAGSGELLNPNTFNWSFDAVVADPVATLGFVINGYRTLDGLNTYADFFVLSINGTEIGSGSFNLGGGGFSAWSGPGTAVTSNTGTSIGGNGGTTTISGVSFALNAGTNNITFSYSPVGYANNGGQTLGDEAWGISSAQVTAVPEPETYAMLLAGLGLMGAIARRRNNAA
jgi:hypothetical protein